MLKNHLYWEHRNVPFEINDSNVPNYPAKILAKDIQAACKNQINKFVKTFLEISEGVE